MTRAHVAELASGFGASVTGIDLKLGIDVATRDLLRIACARYGFLVLPDQRLTFDEQREFGSHFGEVLERGEQATPSVPISDHEEQLSPELLLHFDHWLRDGIPIWLRFTMLHGVAVTPSGGETVLVSTADAYRRLDPKTRSAVTDMSAVDYFDYTAAADTRLGQRVRASVVGSDQPCLTHPIVMRHRETGRSLLVTSPGNTDSVIGLPDQESEALLMHLFETLSNRATRHEHRWRANDLLLWDNMLVAHGRRPYNVGSFRHLRRLSIL